MDRKLTAKKNEPALWRNALPRPAADGNKYGRGHAVVFAAADLTGATRLAATACSRMGAGLVTVIAAQRDDYFRTVLPADIMVRKMVTSDVRNITAVLAGPGGSTLPGNLPDDSYRVLDAGALPLPDDLPGRLARTVLTPHDGEFERSFPALEGTRQQRALAAARATGAIVVLKGAETVIASPDDRLAVNRHATPWLAKAGTGDVLAGMITGLLAQSVAAGTAAAFEMACAAVWMHGEAGRRVGPGLIAGDLEGELRSILGMFLSR